jgi:hypothetical protein
MASKTIKISEKHYKWLLGIAAKLQIEKGKRVTIDDTFELLEVKKGEKGSKENILELAGAWSDMTDKEEKEILEDTKKSWKRWDNVSA